MHFDAVSWHEIGADPAAPSTPAELERHVAVARRLLAERGFEGVEIHINEYSPPSSRLLPGWTVGWLAALERARVDAAMRACWQDTGADGRTYSECDPGGLDGLLDPATGRPQAPYWVHLAYAAMTGNAVVATASGAGLSAFATTSKPGVAALVGRHSTCTKETNVFCPRSSTPTPPPQDVRVVIKTDGSERSVLRVRVTRIDNAPHTPEPAVRTFLAPPMAGGATAFTIPQLADGAAVSLTATPEVPAPARGRRAARTRPGPAAAGRTPPPSTTPPTAIAPEAAPPSPPSAGGAATEPLALVPALVLTAAAHARRRRVREAPGSVP
jgi:hypothetical protein